MLRAALLPALTRRALAIGLLLSGAMGAPVALAATANWTPETLLASDIGFSEFPGNIIAAVNPSGRTVVSWDRPLPSGGFGFGSNFEVMASVRASSADAWSAPRRLSPADVAATGVGAVVDPASGKVTVAWIAAGVSYVSTSSDSGSTWITEPIPASAGFALMPFGDLIDVDNKGNVTLILAKARPASGLHDLQAIARTPGGTWRAPVTLTAAAGVALSGSLRLSVIGDGRALLGIGATTFRRNAAGAWSTAQTVSFAGIDIVDQTSSDMDANGRGYVLLHGITAGVAGTYIATSTPGRNWRTPQHLPALAMLSSSIQVTASSSGRAIISGVDNASTVRVSATRDGGASWGPVVSFGAGLFPRAAGSENGLYAIGWTGPGVSGPGTWLAAGSGSGSAAWTQTTRGDLVRIGTPVVAIAGKPGSSTAKSAASWQQQISATDILSAVGATTATVGR